MITVLKIDGQTEIYQNLKEINDNISCVFSLIHNNIVIFDSLYNKKINKYNGILKEYCNNKNNINVNIILTNIERIEIFNKIQNELYSNNIIDLSIYKDKPHVIVYIFLISLISYGINCSTKEFLFERINTFHKDDIDIVINNYINYIEIIETCDFYEKFNYIVILKLLFEYKNLKITNKKEMIKLLEVDSSFLEYSNDKFTNDEDIILLSKNKKILKEIQNFLFYDFEKTFFNSSSVFYHYIKDYK